MQSPKSYKRVGKTNNSNNYEKDSVPDRMYSIAVCMWRIFSKANGGIKNIAGFQPDLKRQACKIIQTVR